MKLQHVVESQQFTVPLLMELFDRTRQMEKVAARGGTLDYQNRIMASLFYQPSTRTRFSFEAAMYRLGGRVLSTEHARALLVRDRGRAGRGHDPHHRRLLRRHRHPPSRRRAARSARPRCRRCRSSTPATATAASIPTQALLDLYTIYRERPLDGLSIAFIGELDRGRTARSLAYLLSKFERVKIYLRQPARDADEARHPRAPRRARRVVRAGVGAAKVLREVDVVYQTRIRPERLTDRGRHGRYTIDARVSRR